jgi:tRNA uridine 5-carboxymethylaminomethyl modification enzyme
MEFFKDMPTAILRRLEIETKYSGYIERERLSMKPLESLEKILLEDSFDYTKVSGLSTEECDKLLRFKPGNLSQASRMSGITPSSIQILRIFLSKRDRKQGMETLRSSMDGQA